MTNSPSGVTSAVEPRVCNYPTYRYSHVDDVVDQAELAGLFLDDWQKLILRHALGERDDGKWAAFEVALVVARQNGKGSILEARELAGLFLFDEQLILHSAHEYRTAMEAHRRIVACVRRMAQRVNDNLFDYDGIPIKVINTNGEEGVERLDTGQRLQFIARSKNAGRGFTADCLVWDEAYALAEEQVDAQMPTLLARPNTQIWYTSSPPLDAVSGAQLFRVRRRGLNGDDSLAYFDYGADGCLDDLAKVDLDDRALWAQTNPAFRRRISEEAMTRLRAGMSDAGFARECLSIWPPDLVGGYRVIPEPDWAAAADPRHSPLMLPVAFCLEVSWERDWAAIGVAWRRADGLRQVELTRDAGGRVDLRRSTGWIVTRAKQLVDKWKPCAFVVDPGGPAGSMIEDLQAAGIDVTLMTTRDAAQAYGAFFDGVSGRDEEVRDIRHGNQHELNAAVAGAAKRTLGDAWAWDRRNSTGVFCPLGAVTGALWGYTTKASEWSGYDVLESVY